MGWKLFDEVDDNDLTAAEWEKIYLHVNHFGLPHAEVDIDPLHCPTCRIVIATVIVAREVDLAEASTAIGSMPASALVEAFTYDGR